MRFFWRSGALLGLTLGLAVTPKVVAITGTECWPVSDCKTYTADFSGTGQSATDHKTPWSGQIGINKFDTQSGARTLTGVNIHTILYSQTKVFFTRNSTASFSGTVWSGVMFNVDLQSNPGQLGKYWGRWGDYTEGKQQGIDITGQDQNNPTDTTIPLFVEYTYPLFDVLGAVNCGGAINCQSHPALALPLTGGTLPPQDGEAGPVWAYYEPSVDTNTKGWAQYYYGTVSRGTYVERVDDGFQPNGGDSVYYIQNLEPSLDHENVVTFTQADFPVKDQEYQLGTTQTLDHYTDVTSFSKSITLADYPNGVGGGVNKNILPATVLGYFEGTGQIQFDAAATGFYTITDTGGNGASRQETVAKVAIRIEYTYDCAACVVGDPQFGGFQGQSFQVHGYPGSYFNLFSAPSFQLNGRFTYLASGHCNYNHTQCWTHPGTYIDDLAFVVDELLIRVTAGPVGSGYSVLINNEPFHAHQHANLSDITHGYDRPFIPTKFYDPNTRTTVHLKSPLEVVVRTELVSFSIHNADHFFNIDSQLLVRPLMKLGRAPSASYPDPATGKPGFPAYPIHGFIGQTWANKKYPHNRLYQGEPDDYVEPKPYSTESLYSQYNKQFDEKQTSWNQQ